MFHVIRYDYGRHNAILRGHDVIVKRVRSHMYIKVGQLKETTSTDMTFVLLLVITVDCHVSTEFVLSVELLTTDITRVAFETVFRPSSIVNTFRGVIVGMSKKMAPD